jgi:hypothetical protein
MITLIELKKNLNKEWGEKGFFENLRYESLIDFDKGNRLLNQMKSYNLRDEDVTIDRELVRLIWYIPQFMEWQRERLSENNDEESILRYTQLTNYFNNELEKLLGVP